MEWLSLSKKSTSIIAKLSMVGIRTHWFKLRGLFIKENWIGHCKIFDQYVMLKISDQNGIYPVFWRHYIFLFFILIRNIKNIVYVKMKLVENGSLCLKAGVIKSTVAQNALIWRRKEGSKWSRSNEKVAPNKDTVPCPCSGPSLTVRMKFSYHLYLNCSSNCLTPSWARL